MISALPDLTPPAHGPRAPGGGLSPAAAPDQGGAGRGFAGLLDAALPPAAGGLAAGAEAQSAPDAVQAGGLALGPASDLALLPPESATRPPAATALTLTPRPALSGKALPEPGAELPLAELAPPPPAQSAALASVTDGARAATGLLPLAERPHGDKAAGPGETGAGAEAEAEAQPLDAPGAGLAPAAASPFAATAPGAPQHGNSAPSDAELDAGTNPLAAPGPLSADAALSAAPPPPPLALDAAARLAAPPAPSALTGAAPAPLIRGAIAPLPWRVTLPASAPTAATPAASTAAGPAAAAPSPTMPAEALAEALSPPAPASPSVLASAAPSVPDAAALPAAAPLLAPAAGASVSAASAPAPAPQLEQAIAQVGDLREALRAARPELTLRHAEFGAVSLRLEATGAESWRAVLSARDPGFVPAIQAALADRALTAAVAASADTGSFLPQNGTSEQRYGASPNGGQGSSQPYLGQSGGRDGEAAPDHRRSSTTAALAAREQQEAEGSDTSPARQSRGTFA